ncbi:hypothetical protein F0241_18135 [Vibrio kanaloae]|uniref:Uncharacterized protein n=1 Tax=Vibrio kanaloae TaxID=170673 RepID=A0A4V5RHV5_9VIBR|nr:hypothetical protein [Vibrio kanaloae]NOJ01488.1 hypothetical protein [Vibrio kanaloae]TKF02319.1 hypothetical protein FCV46_15740 [Vibrio kanaloae]TKF27632.1 hypothetical protein FCV52_04240 [Vibrio kanaloae]TKF30275.1 hypothetical protein FCV50_14340 [Vibrio kanaloae]
MKVTNIYWRTLLLRFENIMLSLRSKQKKLLDHDKFNTSDTKSSLDNNDGLLAVRYAINILNLDWFSEGTRAK